MSKTKSLSVTISRLDGDIYNQMCDCMERMCVDTGDEFVNIEKQRLLKTSMFRTQFFRVSEALDYHIQVSFDVQINGIFL